ncbi:MAG: hypothetical protein K2X27_14440 [Candidatus Obscuribacterales bacterium]|nr:hypothetical protein [Candidatus Obscuribacterales bacterium]
MNASSKGKLQLSLRYGSNRQESRKKEAQCKIYGHCSGKIRAGASHICAVCGKRFQP